jgi:hypothetical protein
MEMALKSWKRVMPRQRTGCMGDMLGLRKRGESIAR